MANMRAVRVRCEVAQASALVFRTGDLLPRHQTHLICALRGQITKFVIAGTPGPMNAAKRIAVVRNPYSDLPASARAVADVIIAEKSALAERVVKVGSVAVADTVGLEPAGKEAAGGVGAGYVGIRGSAVKKLTLSMDRYAAVEKLKTDHGFSERRVGRLVGVNQSS